MRSDAPRGSAGRPFRHSGCERIRIRHGVVAEIAAHARAEAPNECCGLLVGTDTELLSAVRARNLAASPKGYLIDPRDHIRANASARLADAAVMGAYHSHPHTPPLPSPRDLAEASYPDFLYLIVSLRRPEMPELRAYRFTADYAIAVDLIEE